jgi:hypothetical protein
MRWSLAFVSGDRCTVTPRCDVVLEETLHTVQHLLLRLCGMHGTTKFAAVPHAMREPASELLHFANTVREVGSGNFLEIARK